MIIDKVNDDYNKDDGVYDMTLMMIILRLMMMMTKMTMLMMLMIMTVMIIMPLMMPFIIDDDGGDNEYK